MGESLNPMQKDEAVSILRLDDNTYKVTMQDGSKYRIDGDKCECGHTRDFTPSRSAGFEQSYRNRREASCPHQKAVLNAKNLGACPDCGNYQVREKKMSAQGRHVMSEYICTECGSTLDRQ